jgi:hypothetical protein
MRILLGTCGMIAVSSSARSLYLKGRVDIIAAFAAIFVVSVAPAHAAIARRPVAPRPVSPR